MKLSDEQLDEVAQQVDGGMDAFIHKETGEIVLLPNMQNMDYVDTDAWHADIEKVEENRDAHIQVQDMDSRDECRVMEDFVSGIEDEQIQMVLDVVLNNAKPFRNFKNTLHRFPEVRNHWFVFKQERMIQWVRRQIRLDDE